MSLASGKQRFGKRRLGGKTRRVSRTDFWRKPTEEADRVLPNGSTRSTLGVLVWAETPDLSQGASFSDWVCTDTNKTNAVTGTAPALFNGQRMKWETSLQNNFLNKFRQREISNI